jgi:hypothetical protein
MVKVLHDGNKYCVLHVLNVDAKKLKRALERMVREGRTFARGGALR